MNIGAVPSSRSPTLCSSITSIIILDPPSTNISSQTSNGTHSTSSSDLTTASNSSSTPRAACASSTTNLTFSATNTEFAITSSTSTIVAKSSNSATSLSASFTSINKVITMSSNSPTSPASTPATTVPARDQGARPAQGGENANTTTTSSGSSSSVSTGSSSSSSSTSPTSPSSVSNSSSSSASSSSSTPREQVLSNGTQTSTTSHASTMTSTTVVAKMLPSTTIVSTITDHPETTLKTPLGLLVTDTQGHTTLSYPAIVTETSVVQQPDGSFVTYTHVVANPTEASNEGSKKSFFQNHGAVAGVFLAMGIVLASIVVCAVLLVRRQKKRKRASTQRWIDGLHRPPTRSTQFSDNPFVDNPPMTAVDPRHRVTTQSPDLFRLDEGPLIPLTPTYAAGSTSPTHHYNQPRKQPPRVDEGPFSDTNGFRPIGTEPVPLHTQPFIPSRQSSPSLYPVSDKDESEDIEPDYLPPLAHPRPTVGNSSDSSRPSSTDINPAPPRPPRSMLRTPSKIYESTSPPSETHSSETHVETTRSVSKYVVEDIFARPTLLNVRPRSKDGEIPK